MPKDKRFYMTFPHDFHRHPKLRKLPPEIRWTFVEMNGEACLANNDGLFTEEDAEFMWPEEHLAALCDSHPTRPLVVKVSGGYLIREYGEHQMTAAEREASRTSHATRGRLGGLAKASNSQAVAKQNLPESEHRTIEDKDNLSIYQRVNVQSVRTCIRSAAGLTVSMAEAGALAEDILSRAKDPKDPTAYVRAVIVKDPKAIERRITTARPVHEVKQDPTCPKHPGYPFPCDRCKAGT